MCWGEGEPIQEEYSGDNSCLNSECPKYNQNVLLGGIEALLDVLVGVKLAPIPKPEELKYYAAMCECQSCFSKFWFHFNKPMAEGVYNLRSN